jgi:hypothetical protein
MVRKDYTIEITSDKVSNDQARIEQQYFGDVCHGVAYGNGKVVECICQAVGEAAIDEEGYTEKQSQRFAFTGKGDHGGHDESTTYSQ